MTILDMLKDPT
jgi:hypothetical protein